MKTKVVNCSFAPTLGLVLKKSKWIYVIMSFFILFISCGDENKPSSTEIQSTEFIVINQVNGQGNISVYEYPGKKLTEQFFTINSIFKQPITGAIKDGKSLYLSSRGYYDNIGYYKSKLRKIDLTSGVQINEVDSWIDPGVQHYNYYKGNLVVSYAGYDFKAKKYLSCLKIYDGNLTLKDSITEENVRQMTASTIANNMLFSHVIIESVGSFIRVVDLNTKTLVNSIDAPLFRQFTYLNEKQLLVFLSDNYFVLDTQSLEKSQPIASSVGFNPVAYSSVDNTLYALFNVAQPAIINYNLNKMDLSTGKTLLLTESNESIVGPIIYDVKTNVIVSGGGLKLFSTQGKVLETVDLPNLTSHILIK